MNRFIRMILYITAGCAGIGCAALILSLVLGGGRLGEDAFFGQAKETARDAVELAKKKVHYTVTADDRNGDDSEYADVFSGTMDDTDEGTGMLTIDSSAVQKLSVGLRHGYLSIEESEDSRIQVSVSEPSDQITAKCESGEIIIRDNRQGKSGRKDVTVYLEIPEGFHFQKVDLSMDAGEIDTDCGFSAENLSVNAGAGVISLEDIQADVFSGSVGAGEITIDDSVFQTVRLDCGVGSMDIQADITANARIDCGMGEVDLALVRDISEVNYVLKCGVGSIEIGDNSYSGLSREKRIDHGADAEFELNCGMGMISIDNE